jgi:hypothetical protein
MDFGDLTAKPNARNEMLPCGFISRLASPQVMKRQDFAKKGCATRVS